MPPNIPGSSQLPSESEDDLREELSLLEVMLDSLDDNAHGDANRASELNTQIQTVKAKLAQHRRARDHNRRLPNPAQFSGSARARPVPNADTEGSNHDTMPRKRTYNEHMHNGLAPTAGPSKSRRSTPQQTRSSSPINESSPLDLTGEDEDVFKSRQAQLEDQWRQRRQQEEEDEAMARILQNHVSDGSDTASSSPRLPSSHPSGGPNAFDRMTHMYHPVESSSSRRQETLPLPSSSPAHRFGSPSTIRTHANGSTVPPNSNSGLARYGAGPGNTPSSFSVPSHVKPETSALASSPRPFASNTPRGSSSFNPRELIDISDDDDDRDSGMTSINNLSSFGPSSRLMPGSYPGSMAQQAAVHRQHVVANGYQPHSSYYGMPGPSQPTPSMYQWDRSSSFRPGMVSNGSSNPLRLPLPTPFLHRDRLDDVINRTSSYDYLNGLDSFGRPLSDRLQNYVDDIVDDPRNNEEQIKELLANIRPDMDIPEEDRGDDPKELRYPLYKHQKIALSWMQGMEKDKKKKGGILADDMGLGKTISSLALIVSRQAEPEPGKKFPKAKTTLIVGPLALIRQWEREIAKKIKTPYRLSVVVYHQKKLSFDDLRINDVVLTTYGSLASELTKREKYIKTARENKSPVDDNQLAKICPLTGPKSLWYRVILDEAQCIKNAKTKTAKAASDLQAEYRWCLSGTPMMNSTMELASLIQFLRIQPYCNFNHFRNTFGCLSAANSAKNKHDAMRKLQTVLKAIMLRRTKSSQIDGKPILELPPKEEEIVHVVFGPDEEQYYRDLEKDSQVQVSKFLKDNTRGKKYQVVLTLLLRLRQACCHPHLHITDLDSGGTEEVTQDLMLELAKTLQTDVINRIKEAEGVFECPICFDACENPTLMLPCGHDICTECFGSLSADAVQRNIQDDDGQGNRKASLRCPQCRGTVVINNLINYEAFRKVHMPETLPPEPNEDDEMESGSSSEDDSDSDSEIYGYANGDADKRGNLKGFIVNDTDESDSDNDKKDHYDSDELEDINSIAQRLNKTQGKQGQGKGKTKSKGKGKGKGKGKSKTKKGKAKADAVKPHMLKQLRQDASKNREAKKKYMAYLKKVWEPSAKVDKCTELIQDIQQTGEKTIVFSQWTLLLDLLELPLKEKNIHYRRYDGSMSSTARDVAAHDFMEERDVKVILVSLKAGNAGLNLTSASQVIIMDPFWNPYIEKQAVDRAHRIGQQRPVKVHRILIQDTVEDRIVKLQERKRDLVDSALSEEASKSIGSLGAQELRYLFGLGGLGN